MPTEQCSPAPVSPTLTPGVSGRPSASPVTDRLPPAAWAIQQLGIRTVGIEALDLGVDDARVDFAHLVVAEAQALDHTGAEIFDEDIGLFDQPAQDLLALLVLQIAGDAVLVGVEQHEIDGVDLGIVRRGAPPLLALARRLHLDDIGAEPAEHLRA